MKQPKSIALIIPVYKDIEALKIIIEAISKQTILPNEIVIAEDAQNIEMKEFVDTINIPNVKIYHTFHEDKGWRRNKSTNNALRVVQSEYLIFNDGDCIPKSNFIEAHRMIAEENTVFCGRRSNTGPGYSTKIRSGEMDFQKYDKEYICKYFSLRADDVDHYDEGIYFNPKGLFYKLFSKYFRKKASLLGCSWAVWKKDLEMINGFDEDWDVPTVGEDTDIERRLRHFDVNFKSSRNIGIVYHLHHKKVFNSEICANSHNILKSKLDTFICKNGLNKLD